MASAIIGTVLSAVGTVATEKLIEYIMEDEGVPATRSRSEAKRLTRGRRNVRGPPSRRSLRGRALLRAAPPRAVAVLRTHARALVSRPRTPLIRSPPPPRLPMPLSVGPRPGLRQSQSLNPSSSNPRFAADRLMSAPVSSALVRSTGLPRITSRTEGKSMYFRVQHREYIGEVLASNVYNLNKHPINPGLATEFPWLSGLATKFETYRFAKLAYEFCTEQSTAEPGAVMVMADSDPADAPPEDKQAFMSNANAVRTPVWNTMLRYDVPGSILSRMPGALFFVRRSDESTVNPLSSTDICNVNVACEGSDPNIDGTSLGEVYAVYDVELATPHFEGDTTAADVLFISFSGTDIKADWTQGTVGNAYGGLFSYLGPDPGKPGYFGGGVNRLTFTASMYLMLDITVVGTTLLSSSPSDGDTASPSTVSFGSSITANSGTTVRSLSFYTSAGITKAPGAVCEMLLDLTGWGTVTNVYFKMVRVRQVVQSPVYAGKGTPTSVVFPPHPSNIFTAKPPPRRFPIWPPHEHLNDFEVVSSGSRATAISAGSKASVPKRQA